MYFPPDVSLRVSGEAADWQPLIPAASQFLYRALRVQATGEAGVPVRILHPLPNGGSIEVYLHGDIKNVYIQPKRVPLDVEEVVKPEEEEEELPIPVAMYSGVVTPGTLIDLDGDDAAHAFHATKSCAKAYDLENLYGDFTKLGVRGDTDISDDALQIRSPKPTMYTGAMKRVVQAMYGIGIPEDPKVEDVQNHYDFRWDRTHGIRTVIQKDPGADTETHYLWLIEISRERGVLAMPLPLIPGTDDPNFESYLDGIEDAESLLVVREFGGFPSGEKFPEDDELNDAIDNGDVLRLLTADKMREFYYGTSDVPSEGGGTKDVQKHAWYDECGWAFNGDGTESKVYNTAYWYSNEDAANGTATFALYPVEQRYPRAEMWELDIPLPDTYDTSTFDKKAKLTKFKEGLYYVTNPTYAGGPGFELPFFKPNGERLDLRGMIYSEDDLNADLYICPVHCFYRVKKDGEVKEALEIVWRRPPAPQVLVPVTTSGWLVGDIKHIITGDMFHFYKDHSLLVGAEPPPPVFSWIPQAQWDIYAAENNAAAGGIHYAFAYDNYRNQFESPDPNVWEGQWAKYSYNFPVEGSWTAIDDAGDLGVGWPPPQPPAGVPIDYSNPNYSLRLFDFDLEGQITSGFSYWAMATLNDFYMRFDRAGEFYGDSIDLREDPSYEGHLSTTISTPGATRGGVSTLTYPGPYRIGQEIGLIIPDGIRESYVLMQSKQEYNPVLNPAIKIDSGQYPNGRNERDVTYSAIAVKGFFRDLGAIDFDPVSGIERTAAFQAGDYDIIVPGIGGLLHRTDLYNYAAWWTASWHIVELAPHFEDAQPKFEATVAAQDGKNSYIMHASVWARQVPEPRKTKTKGDKDFKLETDKPHEVTFIGGI